MHWHFDPQHKFSSSDPHRGFANFYWYVSHNFLPEESHKKQLLFFGTKFVKKGLVRILEV